jgi:hypothetical protein
LKAGMKKYNIKHLNIENLTPTNVLALEKKIMNKSIEEKHKDLSDS